MGFGGCGLSELVLWLGRSLIALECALLEKIMDALKKNIAVARGEALAASLLASIAIRTALAMSSRPEELLVGMQTFVDDTLNLSGPGTGDANDGFNTQIRETARFQAAQYLDGIRRMLDDPPTKN